MKKSLLFILFILISYMAFSQDIAISFYQGNVLCEGRTASNKYILACQNMVCTFDASYARGTNGTVIMNVYNPTVQGFIPATYYIYPNNTLSVYVNNQHIASGKWSPIRYNVNSPSFKGKNCRYIVGCDCPGFKPVGTIGGDQFICKKCGHEKKYH